MFDELTRRTTGHRATRCGACAVGSILLHAALAFVLVRVGTRVTPDSERPPIPVTLFRAAPSLPPAGPPREPARRGGPRQPSARPERTRAHVSAARPRTRNRPASAALQPPEQAPTALRPPEQAPAALPASEPPVAPAREAPAGDDVAGGGGGGAAAAGAPRPGATEFDDRMIRPVLISGPNPEYTSEALQHEVGGLMVVKCVIGADGTVRDCLVTRGLPYMDHAVVQALESRRYRPAMLEGKPLDVQYTFKIRLSPN